MFDMSIIKDIIANNDSISKVIFSEPSIKCDVEVKDNQIKIIPKPIVIDTSSIDAIEVASIGELVLHLTRPPHRITLCNWGE